MEPLTSLLLAQAVTIGGVAIPWSLVTGLLLGGGAFATLREQNRNQQKSLEDIKAQVKQLTGEVTALTVEQARFQEQMRLQERIRVGGA